MVEQQPNWTESDHQLTSGKNENGLYNLESVQRLRVSVFFLLPPYTNGTASSGGLEALPTFFPLRRFVQDVHL